MDPDTRCVVSPEIAAETPLLTCLPPFELNTTVYVLATHLAVMVLVLVTLVYVPFQPLNRYPVLVGSDGGVAFFPCSIDCVDKVVPSPFTKVTV